MDDKLRIELNAADIIREYKALFDSGVITQEEFEKKKALLLSENGTEPAERIECVKKGSELLKDGIITEDDFGAIKANIFSDSPKRYMTDLADIRKLDALFRSGLIEESDFEDLKSRVIKFAKINTLGYSGILRLIKTAFDSGVLDGTAYASLKKKFLDPKTDPDPKLNDNLGELTKIHKLLTAGHITEDDYLAFSKKVVDGKAIRNASDLERVVDFSKLLKEGLITEEEYEKIRGTILFGNTNSNFEWPGFFKTVTDLAKKGVLTDDELASLRSAYLEGSSIPDAQAFGKADRYYRLAGEGLFEADEFEILKDRAFSGVEVLTEEKLEGVREYKKLLDDGTINNDDFRQYKANQLGLGSGKKYVIMDAGEIEKKKKNTRKKITLGVIAMILIAAVIGLIIYIPKLQAIKATDKIISEAEDLMNKGQYSEAESKLEEFEEKQEKNLSDEAKSKISSTKSAVYWYSLYDFTNGGEGREVGDSESGIEDATMDYLENAFNEEIGLLQLTNVDGDTAGTMTVTVKVEKTENAKDDDKSDNDNKNEKKEETKESTSDIYGNLTFGFTKSSPDAELTEKNLTPSARITFTYYKSNGSSSEAHNFTGTFPLDQTENFKVEDDKGTDDAVGSFKDGVITIEVRTAEDEEVKIVFDHPKEIKKSSSKSSSSSSGKKKMYSDDSDWKNYDYDSDGQINDQEFQDALGDYLTEHGY